MKNIQNSDWLESLIDDLNKKILDLNAFVIMKMCERVGYIAEKIKNGEDVKTAAEYAAFDMKLIKNEIEKTKKWSKKEIDRIFDKLAAANVDFANDFYTFRNLPNITNYKKNPVLFSIVEKIKKEYKEIFDNISKTEAIGMTDKKGNFVSVQKQYINMINTAVSDVKLNEQQFYNKMRPIVNQLTRSGLRTIDFSNGYKRRIDSQVRMNMMDGIRQLNHLVQEQVGKEFDFDGWEISLHSLCAKDHQGVQGKQYTKEEYERLNKRLKRPIGEMDCRHFAMPIIMGVSEPVYTKEEIKKANDRSNEIVTYKKNGEIKQTTRYDASQIQREYELKIRDARMAVDAGKATGDKTMYERKQKRLTALLAEYKRFSRDVGLNVKMDRTKN